jgi:hypothetical protein
MFVIATILLLQQSLGFVQTRCQRNDNQITFSCVAQVDTSTSDEEGEADIDTYLDEAPVESSPDQIKQDQQLQKQRQKELIRKGADLILDILF